MAGALACPLLATRCPSMCMGPFVISCPRVCFPASSKFGSVGLPSPSRDFVLLGSTVWCL